MQYTLFLIHTICLFIIIFSFLTHQNIHSDFLETVLPASFMLLCVCMLPFVMKEHGMF